LKLVRPLDHEIFSDDISNGSVVYHPNTQTWLAMNMGANESRDAISYSTPELSYSAQPCLAIFSAWPTPCTGLQHTKIQIQQFDG